MIKAYFKNIKNIIILIQKYYHSLKFNLILNNKQNNNFINFHNKI